MSRTLVLSALGLFVLVGLLPLVVMFFRIEGQDLTGLFEERALSLLGRTLMLGASTALGALVLGVPFGFLVARTDVPGAGWMRTAGVVPLILPPLMLAMSWAVILPDFRGAPATIAFMILGTFPLVAIFSARAFERVDARQEEAALLCGGLWAALRMELPLVLPAASCGACLAFTFAVNDFAVPDYVSSIGPKFNVYADEIKLNWNQFGRPGQAVAAAVPLIAITLAVLIPSMALRRKGSMQSLGGGFVSPGTLALGRWRWPACAFAGGLLLLSCGVPLGRLLWEAAAMPQHLEEHGSGAFAMALPTLRAEFSIALERAKEDIGNSLLYASAAALFCAPIGLILGHAVERLQGRVLGRLLEAVALLPIAAPAILFGIGVVNLWNHDATARFYDSGWMATTLLAGRFVAFSILLFSGATAALNPELEEAGALAGAPAWKRLFAIVAPTLRGALVASFVLVFVFAMRDLDASILVPAANKTAMLRVFNGVHFGRDSYVAALCLLVIFAILLPGILWSLFARKRLEVLP